LGGAAVSTFFITMAAFAVALGLSGSDTLPPWAEAPLWISGLLVWWWRYSVRRRKAWKVYDKIRAPIGELNLRQVEEQARSMNRLRRGSSWWAISAAFAIMAGFFAFVVIWRPYLDHMYDLEPVGPTPFVDYQLPPDLSLPRQPPSSRQRSA
jgi:hypothetical protein